MPLVGSPSLARRHHRIVQSPRTSGPAETSRTAPAPRAERRGDGLDMGDDPAIEPERGVVNLAAVVDDGRVRVEPWSVGRLERRPRAERGDRRVELVRVLGATSTAAPPRPARPARRREHSLVTGLDGPAEPRDRDGEVVGALASERRLGERPV